MRHKTPRKQDSVAPDKQPKERCMICKKVLDRVSPGHLREHGFTLERYDRMFGMRCAPSRSHRLPTGSVSDPNPALIGAIAERLTEDKAWVACISDEVGERMLTGPLKQRMSVLITTMLYQRAKVHGQSMAILSGALTELAQDWRLAQGGKDHGPTDTDVLLRIVTAGAKLVKDSEEAVQRTMKLALEEQRTAKDYADGAGAPLYQGTGETLDMPVGVTGGDRENIRQLLNMIGRHATEANTIDGEVVAPVEEQDEQTRAPGGSLLKALTVKAQAMQEDASSVSEGTDPLAMQSVASTKKKRRRRKKPGPPLPF